MVAFEAKTLQVRNNNEYPIVPTGQIEYMDVSPQQLVSVATAMIPFLGKRRRQPCPDGREHAATGGSDASSDGSARQDGYRSIAPRLDSGAIIVARRGGRVRKVTSEEVVIESTGGKIDTYPLLNMIRSNQATCITQRPIVTNGQRVRQGQTSSLTDLVRINGELALGQNVLVAFMPWNGYNYEDAILLSQRLVKRRCVYLNPH